MELFESERATKEKVDFEFIKKLKPLLIVCLGMGRDSVAVLIKLKQLGLRPDLIIFADLGAEKQKTYDYIPILAEWLKSVDFPEISIVKAERTRDSSFESHLFRLGVFASLSYGLHKCSVIWKIEMIDKFLKNNHLYQTALLEGREVVKCVGFEAGEEYRANRQEAKKQAGTSFEVEEFGKTWFPLMEFGIDLAHCIQLIKEHIGIVPKKSSCYFCPAMRVEETEELEQTEPEKFFKGLVLERLAQMNTIVPHQRVQGITFGKKWSDLACAAKYAEAVTIVINAFDLERKKEDAGNCGNLWQFKKQKVDAFLAFCRSSAFTDFLTTKSIAEEFLQMAVLTKIEQPQRNLFVN